MNPIDDMFRKGLDGRSGEVPDDMWSRVQAGRGAPAPEGEALDKLFADGLKDHAGQVPAGMWSRIAAAGLPAAAAVDQVFTDGLKDRVGNVPAGMWDKIWKARTVSPYFTTGRWASAAAVLLLLLLAGWWLLPDTGDGVLAVNQLEPSAEVTAEDRLFEHVEILDAGENPVGDSRLSNDRVYEAGEVPVGNSRLSNDRVYEAGEVPVGDSRLSNDRVSDAGEVPVGNSRLSNDRVYEAGEVPVGDSRLSNDRVYEAGEVPVGDSRLSNDRVYEAGEVPVGDSRLSNDRISKAGEIAVGDSRLSNQKAATATLPTSTTPAPIIYDAGPTDIKVKGRYRPKPSNDRAFRAAPRHRFQAELLFGAAYADQQLTAATAADRPLSTLREVSEFPELSYQVSLRGAYNLGKRLTLLGGLTYAEIRNQFEFERTANGTTSLIRTNNSLRMLEAPLLLGYRMPGRRLQVALNAGPVVNLSTQARGSFLDPDSPQPLDLAADGNYRRSVGVGFMTSLSTTYQIGKKEPFVLLVEPFFKAYPTAFTTPDARVKETYWVAGLQLGVRKGF